MFDIGQYLQEGRKYYIYGTREIGEYLYNKIEGQWGSEAVEGFLETSPTIVECNGKRVYALSQVAGLDFDEDTYFLLAAANAYEDMRQNLVKRGIQNDRIITLKEMYPYFKNIRLYKGGADTKSLLLASYQRRRYRYSEKNKLVFAGASKCYGMV